MINRESINERYANDNRQPFTLRWCSQYVTRFMVSPPFEGTYYLLMGYWLVHPDIEPFNHGYERDED